MTDVSKALLKLTMVIIMKQIYLRRTKIVHADGSDAWVDRLYRSGRGSDPAFVAPIDRTKTFRSGRTAFRSKTRCSDQKNFNYETEPTQ